MCLHWRGCRLVPRILNLVVTCTDRKRGEPTPELRARDLPEMEAPQRCADWIKRLKATTTKPTPASELYAGNHWHVVRSVVANAMRQDIDLKVWVLSAGYGLIPFDAPIVPYAASFSRGPDQVTTLKESPRWWKRLAKWKGPTPSKPRTIRELAERTDKVPMLVAASASYVRATLADLVDAERILSQARLAVISAGFAGDKSIESVLLPCDARFLQNRRGTAHSLNVKLAAWALEEFRDWEHDFSRLHLQFDRQLARLHAPEVIHRTPCTDQTVTRFIKNRVKQGQLSGYTVLLGEFRRSGLACEQKRFKLLYGTVANGMSR